MSAISTAGRQRLRQNDGNGLFTWLPLGEPAIALATRSLWNVPHGFGRPSARQLQTGVKPAPVNRGVAAAP